MVSPAADGSGPHEGALHGAIIQRQSLIEPTEPFKIQVRY